MKIKEIKAYAIQLQAMETVAKTEEFKELMDKTGSLGVKPDYPFAYVLYRTHEERMKAFKEFGKVFDYCKVVRNEAYIPDPRGEYDAKKI